MVKKWSVSYPAVNGVEQRRVYVYLPTMYEADPERWKQHPSLLDCEPWTPSAPEEETSGQS